MLDLLDLDNVGPAPALRADFQSRLNLIVGDNGLGKSFLLDVAWWALTRTWAHRQAARFDESKPASIKFTFDAKNKKISYAAPFDQDTQRWKGKHGRPPSPGLVLYAQVDGSFSVWDPARNYWIKTKDGDIQERPPAYHFKPEEVWRGLSWNEKTVCAGLDRDWVTWQQRKDSSLFKVLAHALKTLSPPGERPLTPGEPKKLDIDVDHLFPTISTEYADDVPLAHASAGVRRVAALAYLLVWSWEQHVQACHAYGRERAHEVIFLIDEVESHLHPRWQRGILRSLLELTRALATGNLPRASVQLIAATHSPLVLASAEPLFDDEQDALFLLDLVRSKEKPSQARVRIDQRPWAKHGSVNAWLQSYIFGLGQARSVEAEAAIAAATKWMAGKTVAEPLDTKRKIAAALKRALPDQDPFWPRWIAHAARKSPASDESE
jgi:hypothetical protein